MAAKRPIRSVVNPVLRRWLAAVFFLFALLAVNSVYLGGITLLEQASGEIHQDFFYLTMFLGHLVLGLILIVPFLVFGILHLRRAWHRPNRAAVYAGVGVFASGLAVLISGILLTRFGFFEVNNPTVRQVGYWLHIVTPFAAVWLFVLHRLAGSRIRWRGGAQWAAVAVAFTAVMVGYKAMVDQPADPGEPILQPSLLRTAGGEHLNPDAFMTDEFCAECHEDIAESWAQSVHRFSSFNNPAYSFSVQETRKVGMQRDGKVEVARFCGGCHDIVPMVSGKFDDPNFDIVNDPTAHAGLTCTSCHAITHVNSVRGNADFTLDEPVTYPFESSENGFLREVSKQLIMAKPEYHKMGLNRDVLKTTEFCSTCHKAHMTYEVNHYKWLRGQNHYDSFNQSGMPGHRVDSFYYPPKAFEKCADCHMPLIPSEDPAARDFNGSGIRTVHSHLFPAANTGLAHMVGLKPETMEAHKQMLEGAVRVDIFGIREAGEIDGKLKPLLDKNRPQLEPGKRYLVEAVVRNLKVGHHLTQGTADSNELWVDVNVKAGDRLIGRSGGMAEDGQVDPWAFFLNAYVLTPEGERLDRRNGQDTFVALYSHQIPPGAAGVVHYLVEVPEGYQGPVTLEAAVKYRKFDTTYLKYIQGDDFKGNDLPIVTMASDSVELAVGEAEITPSSPKAVEDWERWNDYGIGLLIGGSAQKATLRQAEAAFKEVEALGRGDGPLNLARVYLKEGRIDEAAKALQRAAETYPDFRPWTRAWLTALIDRENGHLDQAIATLRTLFETPFQEARAKNFDFSMDYRARNTLGRTLYERARMARGEKRKAKREQLLNEALAEFQRVLELDPENLTAHYSLALVYSDLGNKELAAEHRELHAKYKPDDHAVERAVAVHRRENPAADHAAEPVAIYDLQRPGAYELPATNLAEDSSSRVGADG